MRAEMAKRIRYVIDPNGRYFVTNGGLGLSKDKKIVCREDGKTVLSFVSPNLANHLCHHANLGEINLENPTYIEYESSKFSN